MNLKKFLIDNELESYPAGLGGCRANNSHFDICAYDIFVFDNRTGRDFIQYDDSYAIIHHTSTSASTSKDLLACERMCIIQDESWELRMHQAKVHSKREMLFTDLAKDRLIEALFYTRRTQDAIETSNMFAPIWQKCASYCLADAICLLNYQLPSPSHMLELFRILPKNSINEHIISVTETIDMERSTHTLLDRMFKSTIGFSDMVQLGLAQIITQKYKYFQRNSMPTDSYFYLGYTTKQNFERISSQNRHSDVFHVLKTALDIQTDTNSTDAHTRLVKTSCNVLLEDISRL